jgi:hypothetical protein
MEVTYSQEFTQLSLVFRHYLKIASIFSRSAFTPSSEITWPRNLISGLQNWCFAALTVKPALVSLSGTKSMWCRRSVKVDEWIRRSFTYITKLLFRSQSPITFSKALMSAARLFLKPQGTVLNWYTLHSMWNAVHYLEDCSRGTCRKALLRSILVIYFCKSSRTGIISVR